MIKNQILSYGETVIPAAYGLLNSSTVDAEGYFNHALYVYFGSIGANALTSTMDFFIDMFTPACFQTIKNIPGYIRQKIGTVDFSTTAPFDTIFTFGGNATISAILPGMTFFKYRIVCKSNVVALTATANIELKSVGLILSNNGNEKSTVTDLR